MDGLPVVKIEHTMTEAQLSDTFGEDGYQVYHTVENEREDLTIAGCWSHARRRFDEAVKALPESKRKDSRAYLALTMIQAIYREEKTLKDLPVEERQNRRQLSVRPLVEAYFTWVRENISKVPAKVNNLKPYDYFEYLLTEIPRHLDDTDRSFCEDLLPWSPNLPEHCRKPDKNRNK